jgi:hypothetical protein
VKTIYNNKIFAYQEKSLYGLEIFQYYLYINMLIIIHKLLINYEDINGKRSIEKHKKSL